MRVRIDPETPSHLSVHELAEDNIDKDVLVVRKEESLGQFLVGKHIAYKLQDGICIAARQAWVHNSWILSMHGTHIQHKLIDLPCAS